MNYYLFFLSFQNGRQITEFYLVHGNKKAIFLKINLRNRIKINNLEGFH